MVLTEILEIPLFLVLLGRLSVHEVVEALATLKKVVDATHDTEDTEREDPDTDNSDNAGLATNEPTEDTEECGNDVDNKDSARQLPRGDGGPERTVSTCDEDEPVLSEGNLKEEDLITNTEVLDDTTAHTLASTVGDILVREHGGEGNPGTNSQDDTEQNGHTPKLGKVPLHGGLAERSVVVRDSECGNVGENGNEHN